MPLCALVGQGDVLALPRWPATLPLVRTDVTGKQGPARLPRRRVHVPVQSCPTTRPTPSSTSAVRIAPDRPVGKDCGYGQTAGRPHGPGRARPDRQRQLPGGQRGDPPPRGVLREQGRRGALALPLAHTPVGNSDPGGSGMENNERRARDAGSGRGVGFMASAQTTSESMLGHFGPVQITLAQTEKPWGPRRRHVLALHGQHLREDSRRPSGSATPALPGTPWICCASGRTPPRSSDSHLRARAPGGRSSGPCIPTRRGSRRNRRCWPPSLSPSSRHWRPRARSAAAASSFPCSARGDWGCPSAASPHRS